MFEVYTLLQCRKVPDLRNLVQSMLNTTEVWPPNSMTKHTLQAKGVARETWRFVLEKVIAQGGPYVGRIKSEKLDPVITHPFFLVIIIPDALVSTAVRLFPWGVPKRSSGWRRPHLKVENSEYQARLKEIPRRTVPTPNLKQCFITLFNFHIYVIQRKVVAGTP